MGTDTELAGLQRRYRVLLDQIRDLGFIATGSVTERYTACTAACCHCHADPPQRHGPYHQYTGKVTGKTSHRPAQRQTGPALPGTDRQPAHLDRIIAAMVDLSTQARDLLTTTDEPRQDKRTRRRTAT
jgi:hypothetical protein